MLNAATDNHTHFTLGWSALKRGGSSPQPLTEEHARSGADFNSLAHLLWQSMREIEFKGFKFGLTWFVTSNPFRH